MISPEKLKDQIYRIMLSRGVDCSPANILLTIGAQEGFSYLAFRQTAEPYSPRVITIPSSSNSGIDVEAAADALRGSPRQALLYLMAGGHNPLGVAVPIESRRRLAGLAREFQVPIIEDDSYGFLRYEGNNIPLIRTIEKDWVYHVTLAQDSVLW